MNFDDNLTDSFTVDNKFSINKEDDRKSWIKEDHLGRN